MKSNNALFDSIRIHESKYPLLRRCFRVEGVRAGIFDIFVDVPTINPELSDVDYQTFYYGLRIELKAPGGKMSDAQTDWLNYYREAGYRAEVCFSWETAWNIICDYLGYEEIKV